MADFAFCLHPCASHVSTRSRPKVADKADAAKTAAIAVSTRSRPKVAEVIGYWFMVIDLRFNTQPPEGG